jgi:hypothetical protein
LNKPPIREEEKNRFFLETAIFSSFKTVSWKEEELIFQYSSSFAQEQLEEQQGGKNACCCSTI